MTVVLIVAAVMTLPVSLTIAFIAACKLHDHWCRRQPVSPTVTAWEAETEASITEALRLVADDDLGWSASPIGDRHEEFGRDFEAIRGLPERDES